MKESAEPKSFGKLGVIRQEHAHGRARGRRVDPRRRANVAIVDQNRRGLSTPFT